MNSEEIQDALECAYERLKVPEEFYLWLIKCPETQEFRGSTEECPLARYLQESCKTDNFFMGRQSFWIGGYEGDNAPLWCEDFTTAFDDIYRGGVCLPLTKEKPLQIIRDIIKKEEK